MRAFLRRSRHAPAVDTRTAEVLAKLEVLAEQFHVEADRFAAQNDALTRALKLADLQKDGRAAG